MDLLFTLCTELMQINIVDLRRRGRIGSLGPKLNPLKSPRARLCATYNSVVCDNDVGLWINAIGSRSLRLYSAAVGKPGTCLRVALYGGFTYSIAHIDYKFNKYPESFINNTVLSINFTRVTK